MLSLSVLISQALVAFTIEYDNESEHRVQHWITRSAARQGVWLVSMAMWWNCLRFVGRQPVSLKELQHLARTKTNLHGMQRWGYITVDRAPPKLIRATAKGLEAREVFAALPGIIEARWEERFGREAVDRLRQALWTIVSQCELDLPDCLPILGYGLFSIGPDRKRTAPVERDLALATLLSRALLMLAMDFESESDLSLALCANILRVLNAEGVRVRDIPILSGVSKESIAMAMGVLSKKKLVEIKASLVRLTLSGAAAQEAYHRRLAQVEERWKDGDALRDALQPFSGELLRKGIEPYPEGWRASVRRPDVLPYFPMVLHRGGYPDGS